MSHKNLAYKPEIDGLRAIAVLSVLLFHGGVSTLSGGFVGVDVFFVISGYLITSLIIKDIEAKRFSFIQFYERRIRRLLPPLVPVLLFTWGGAVLLLTDSQFQSFTYSLYSAVGFVSNWFFLSTVGYFDGPGELTPLLHIWSLSIEEQFYFIFPVILLMIAKLPNFVRVLVVVAILTISLVYANILLFADQMDMAFFNSFARFWELLIGCLLAMVAFKRPKTVVASNILEISGILMILIPVFFYESTMIFPGYAALPPVLGTALIISAGGGWLSSHVLKSKPFTAIGLISYALYLWHWPLLVFLRIINPSPSWIEISTALAIAALLAIVSYFVIEQPIRKRKFFLSTRKLYVGAIAYSVVVVLIGIVGSSKEMYETRRYAFSTVREILFTGNKAEILATLEQEEVYYMDNLNLNFLGLKHTYDHDLHGTWTCSFDQGNTVERVTDCVLKQAEEQNILVLGDSIARDTRHALRLVYPKANFVMIHKSSCPPHRGDGCFMGLEEVLENISKEMNINGIVINIRYRDSDWGKVVSGLDLAKIYSDNVIFFGVSPMFTMTLPEYIKSLADNDPVPMYIDIDDPKLTAWSFEGLKKEAQNLAEEKDVDFLNVTQFFCPNDRCRIWINDRIGDPMFFDQQHLTKAGVKEFAEFLQTRNELSSFMNRSLKEKQQG